MGPAVGTAGAAGSPGGALTAGAAGTGTQLGTAGEGGGGGAKTNDHCVPLVLPASIDDTFEAGGEAPTYCFVVPVGVAFMVTVASRTDGISGGDFTLTSPDDPSLDRIGVYSRYDLGRTFGRASLATEQRYDVAVTGVASTEYRLTVEEIPLMDLDENLAGTASGAGTSTFHYLPIGTPELVRAALMSDNVCGRLRIDLLELDGTSLAQHRATPANCRQYGATAPLELSAEGYAVELEAVDADSTGTWEHAVTRIASPRPIPGSERVREVSDTTTWIGETHFWSLELQAGQPLTFVLSTPGSHNAVANVGSPGAAPFYSYSVALPGGLRTTPFESADDSGLFIAETAGTYLVQIETAAISAADPYRDGLVGGYSLQAVSPIESTVAVGSAVNGSVDQPYDFRRYSFSVATGQEITVQITNDTVTNYLYGRLYAPDGAELDEDRATQSGVFTLGPWTATTSGLYLLELDPTADNTGSYEIQVTVAN